jgi:signal transduction histidine kinase/CheY-like chemotaxis protein
MQGSPAGIACEPDIVGRRALDLVFRLLNASDDDPTGLEALAADLAVAFDASAAGLASLDGGGAVVRVRTGSAAGDSPRRPWDDDPDLPDRARAAPVALCVARPGGGSLLLTVAATRGEAGWLVWVEDPNRPEWEPPLPAALALVGQALARRMAPEGSRPRWAEQLERMARQQRLEGAAGVARRLAHDFGNILTGILGFSELSLTQSVTPDSALHRYLMEVYRGAQAGAAFTAVLRDEEVRVRLLWGESPFRLAVPEDLPPLGIDADHLRQVLATLLDNARDAAGPSGTVLCSARLTRLTADDCLDYYGDPRPGEHIEIVVADDGPGLAPEVRRRLFAEPFFSTKPRRRGLGLATAYGIVHAHHGGILLSPGPQGGTRAQVTLPVAEPPGSEPEAANGSTATPTPGEKVLVVDDDPRVLQFVAATLERAGYRVQAVGGAEDAIDRYTAARTDPFRLVLSDVLMPEVNGVDLARRLRTLDPEVRVLFMSGHVGPDFPRQELEGWQFELLPKPFRVESLLRAVRGALDRAPGRKSAKPAGDGPVCSSTRQ